MWLHHLLNLLASAGSIFFNAIGTTLLGRVIDIAFAISLAITVLYKTHREQGMSAMMKHWRQEYKAGIHFALWCALIIYFPVAIWSLVKAVYEDHLDLVTRSRVQRSLISGDAAELQKTKNALGGQISDWQAKCSGMEGANGVLSNQNRDQQNTINNCQSQALKLLKPEDLKVYFFPVQSVPKGGEKWVVYVAVTNKIVTPVYIEVDCDGPIFNPQGYALNNLFMNYGSRMNPDGKGFSFGITSPAFAPNQPLGIEYGYTGDKAPNCELKTR